MASQAESAEYSTIRKNFMKLKEVVTRGDIPAALFQEGLITQDVVRNAKNDTISQEKRANDVMDEVLDAVRISAAMFDNFCDALAVEPVAERVVDDLRSKLPHPWVWRHN